MSDSENRGSDQLVRVLEAGGVDLCFANPGTTEVGIVKSLEQSTIRTVLCLFEGVASGAADGFWRISGKVAATLFHLGPGLLNAGANLHNARRANSGILNLVGEFPSWLKELSPPLETDLVRLSQLLSDQVARIESPSEIVTKSWEALREAQLGRISTLLLPSDISWSSVDPVAVQIPRMDSNRRDDIDIESGIRLLKRNQKTAIILGGEALSKHGLLFAKSIQREYNCSLYYECFPKKMECGRSFPEMKRVPYVEDMLQVEFESFQNIFLVDTGKPRPFFSDSKNPTFSFGSEQILLSLGRPGDGRHVLEALAEGLKIEDCEHSSTTAPGDREFSNVKLNHRTLGSILAAYQPESAIIVDEGISSTSGYLNAAKNCSDFSYLSLTGGACGFGLPCAIGASLAAPKRKTIALIGDGSSMYTNQALWTQAREGLNILNIIISNRKYKILQAEYTIKTGELLSPQMKNLTQFDCPPIDWVGLGRSMGIKSEKASDSETYCRMLKEFMPSEGPCLIEVEVK